MKKIKRVIPYFLILVLVISFTGFISMDLYSRNAKECWSMFKMCMDGGMYMIPGGPLYCGIGYAFCVKYM